MRLSCDLAGCRVVGRSLFGGLLRQGEPASACMRLDCVSPIALILRELRKVGSAMV